MAAQYRSPYDRSPYGSRYDHTPQGRANADYGYDRRPEADQDDPYEPYDDPRQYDPRQYRAPQYRASQHGEPRDDRPQYEDPAEYEDRPSWDPRYENRPYDDPQHDDRRYRDHRRYRDQQYEDQYSEPHSPEAPYQAPDGRYPARRPAADRQLDERPGVDPHDPEFTRRRPGTPSRRHRPRHPTQPMSPVTLMRRTGVATAVVSTLGIAMVNTTGIAQSQTPQPATPTTAGALASTIELAAPATGGPGGDPFLDQLADYYLTYDQAMAQASLQYVGQSAAEAAAEREQAEARRWCQPMQGRITQRFGGPEPHLGIDVGAAYGTSVVAAHRGTVLYAGWASGYGRFVTIQHENNVVTAYGHLSRIDVVAGEEVATGEQIGLEGSSGRSTGPHLHFEVRLNGEDGTEVDPLAWLSGHDVTY